MEVVSFKLNMFLKKIRKIISEIFLRMQRAKKTRPILISTFSFFLFIGLIFLHIHQVSALTTIKAMDIRNNIATGGTITTITQNGIVYKVHTFTSDGTFTVLKGGLKVWYLVVAGGGGGGRPNNGAGGAGGGGAGGLRTNPGYDFSVPPQAYTVTVGAGGAGSVTNDVNGTNGSNSVFGSITSTGGGGGAGNATAAGSNGGSGGGGGQVSGAGGTGSSGQGNNGATSISNFDSGQGGGGAGAAGNRSTGSPNTAGAGGDGRLISISGTPTYYAGGGGGGRHLTQPGGAGGAGGGGAGAINTANATDGTANTGGGGGGAASNGGAGPAGNGGTGGSGIVIIRYPVGVARQASVIPNGSGLSTTPITATGGTITTFTQNRITYKVHTFTSTGTSTFQVTSGSGKVWYLVVAGGGGGGGSSFGHAGGGGAGGLLTSDGYAYSVTPQSYTVVVGAGGASGPGGCGGGYCGFTGSNGGNSIFGSLTALGGGGGSGYNNAAAGSGGSGGGNGQQGGGLGLGTSGQGNNGGGNTGNGAGGGGGAGAAGGYGNGDRGGNGGNGRSIAITGSSVYYAGGGGGSTHEGCGCPHGTGGLGGGGNAYTSATANTGGGGGAVANGGSGIVIIRYPISKPNQQSLTLNNKNNSGLVGYWSFDGGKMTNATATDSMGNNDGTLMNNPARVYGRIGQALEFSTTNGSFVDITNSSSLNPSLVTVSAWFKVSTLSTRPHIVGKGGSGAGAYYLVIETNGQPEFYYTKNGGLWATVAGAIGSIVPNKWYQIVGVYDGVKAYLYINGSLVNNVTDAGSLSTSDTNNLRIGRDTSNPSVNGLIDDVRIYNRALSATEILQLYHMGAR